MKSAVWGEQIQGINEKDQVANHNIWCKGKNKIIKTLATSLSK